MCHPTCHPPCPLCVTPRVAPHVAPHVPIATPVPLCTPVSPLRSPSIPRCPQRCAPPPITAVPHPRVRIGDRCDTVFLLSGTDPGIHLYREVSGERGGGETGAGGRTDRQTDGRTDGQTRCPAVPGVPTSLMSPHRTRGCISLRSSRSMSSSRSCRSCPAGGSSGPVVPFVPMMSPWCPPNVPAVSWCPHIPIVSP